jgi:glycosyltransferase involved in cell wall biosynthesis
LDVHCRPENTAFAVAEHGAQAPGTRIVFDLSTSARWSGPPVGIVRVERELARWAHVNVADTVFAGFNSNEQAYQRIARADVICGTASIDPLGLSNPACERRRKTDRIPSAFKPAALWILQFRRKLLQSLERNRLRAKNAVAIHAIDKLQRMIMSPRHRSLMLEPDGRRRPYIPWKMAFMGEIEFGATDILVCAGSGWAHTNIRAISRCKANSNFRLVLLCYDVIPLLFPQFYRPRDAEAFRAYFEIAFPLADLVVFTSRTVAADAQAYCHGRGITLRRTAVIPLGADSVSRFPAVAPLPAGLRPGRYALLVSTVEPRKGHRMIYRVWQRLVREGIPRSTKFSLLFVGRRGWLMDDLEELIVRDCATGRSFRYLPAVDDRTLAALYRGAAFCLYPSLYEGYGLPVFEAFSHGKAVLASNGGALGEIAAELSPLLDPNDEEAWYRALKAWILDPAAREPFEEAIRQFKHQSWAEAAAAFFSLIEDVAVTHHAERPAADAGS